MRHKQERAGQFFLKRKGDIWFICWYDKATRQTRGLSTRLSDRDEAKTALLQHAVNAGRPQFDGSLALVLQTYYDKYGWNLPSAHVQRAAQRDALKIWGDVDVSALDRRRQLEFVATLRARSLSDWTIQARLTRIWAALNWFRRDHTTFVVPAQITAADWKPLLENRDQVYTLDELAALFNACEAVDSLYPREHWRRFLVLAVATCSRATALLELTWDQVNTEIGRIYLNPPGRRQTKKRRATVPICETLARELAEWKAAIADTNEKSLITYYGKPLRSREFYDNLAEAAGVTGGPNVIRHTVRTWLAESGVPDSEADTFMGHKDDGSATGARYKHRRPEYLTNVTRALEELFGELAARVRRPFAGPILEEQPLPNNLPTVAHDNLEVVTVQRVDSVSPAEVTNPVTLQVVENYEDLERETRLELATPTLARPPDSK